MRFTLRAAFLLSALLAALPAQTASKETEAKPDVPAEFRSTYVLGPDDQLQVRVLEVDEIGAAPIRIDSTGYIRLPYAGRIQAAGLTVEQLQAAITEKMKTYVHEPDATVNVVELRSQPVSVFGAVRNPGVHQLAGRKSLVEVLSLAGGLDIQNAGPTIKITRRLEWGKIPLRNAWDDPTGQYSVAHVNVRSIQEATNPEENIMIRPYDVISVPKAGTVYVMGQVMKAGGFMLNERDGISVLEALAMAGGTDRVAAPQHSRILRAAGPGKDRTEIPIDIKSLLQGKGEDVHLQPDDILFVPDSLPKKAAIRALEAAIQAGTGIVVWRR